MIVELNIEKLSETNPFPIILKELYMHFVCSHPLILYTILLSKQFQSSGNQVTFENVGYKKTAECNIIGKPSRFTYYYQYIYKFKVDIPYHGNLNLTDFEINHLIPNLIIKGNQSQYLLLDLEFCPLNITYICGFSNNGAKLYSTSVKLKATEFPKGYMKSINENISECVFDQPIYAIKFFCRWPVMPFLGLDHPPPEVFPDAYQLYHDIKVSGNRIYFNYLYMMELTKCFCVGNYNSSPVFHDQYIVFSLPYKNFTLLEISPNPPLFLARIYCSLKKNVPTRPLKIYCYACDKHYSQGYCINFYIDENSVMFEKKQIVDFMICKCISIMNNSDIPYTEIAIIPTTSASLSVVTVQNTFCNLTCGPLHAEEYTVVYLCNFPFKRMLKLGEKGVNLSSKADTDVYNSLLVENKTLSIYYYWIPAYYVCFCEVNFTKIPKLTLYYSFKLDPLWSVQVSLKTERYNELFISTCLFTRKVADLQYVWGCYSTANDNFQTKFINDLLLSPMAIHLSYGTLETEFNCFCKLSFKYFIPPTPPTSRFNVNFKLPQTEKMTLNPENPKMLDYVSCEIGSRYYKNLSWFCLFDNVNVSLGSSSNEDNLASISKYLYRNIIVMFPNRIKLNFQINFQTVCCGCQVTYKSKYIPYQRKTFFLPINDNSALNLNPYIPVIFQNLECIYKPNPSGLFYYWGCNSFSSDNKETEFIQDLKIKDNILNLNYGRLMMTYKCFCGLTLTNSSTSVDKIIILRKIEFELPQTENVMIIPEVPIISDTATCRTKSNKYKQLNWWCVLDNKSVNLRLKTNIWIFTPFFRYIYENIIFDLPNQIRFTYEINMIFIPCWCEVTYKSRFLPFNFKNFVLPKTKLPDLVLIPTKFSFNTRIECNTKIKRLFLFGWRCYYDNRVIPMNKSMYYVTNSTEIDYFTRAFNVDQEVIIVKPLFLKTETYCECFIRIRGETDEIPIVAGFKIPKSDVLFRSMDINCTHPCKYNAHERKIFEQRSKIIYPTIYSYSTFIISSVILNFHKEYQNAIYNRFFPMESVSKRFSMTCLSIIWRLVWKNSNQTIFKGSWSIMIYNQTGKNTITSNIYPKYNSALRKIDFSCSLKDYQGKNTVANFAIFPIKWIDLFYMYQEHFHINSNVTFSKEIKVTCLIAIITINMREWCRIYKLGEIEKLFSMDYYKNFTVLTFNVQKLSDPIKMIVGIYFPLKITIKNLTTYPLIKFNKTIDNIEDIPLETVSFTPVKYSKDGLYQLFYIYQWNSLNYSERKLIYYAFYDNNLKLHLHPYRSMRGFHVTCLSNSLNRLFIFKWFCKFQNKYIEILSSIDKYDKHTYNTYKDILDNLVIFESQSLRFEYLLQPNDYPCICSIQSYALSGESVMRSHFYDFKVGLYDFLFFSKMYPEIVHPYFVIVGLLWWFILKVIFLIITMYQTYLMNMEILYIQLYLLTGILMKNQLNYKKEFLYHSVYVAGDMKRYSKYFEHLYYTYKAKQMKRKEAESIFSHKPFKILELWKSQTIAETPSSTLNLKFKKREISLDMLSSLMTEKTYVVKKSKKNSFQRKIRQKKILQIRERMMLQDDLRFFPRPEFKFGRLYEQKLTISNDRDDLRFFPRPEFKFGRLYEQKSQFSWRMD